MASHAAQQMANSGTDSPAKKLTSPLITTGSHKAANLSNIVPPADECPYTQYYCEENVWLLCDTVRRKQPAELVRCHVVIITNDARCVPLWRQRAGKTDDKLVTWDYHIIFMYQTDDRYLVFDLDSDLPFPTYFQKYVTETLRTDHILHPQHHRLFRVVPASLFLQKFASDRRHMRRDDGSWLHPPPSHPPIRTQESVHTLDEFLNMDTNKVGAAAAAAGAGAGATAGAGVGGTVYNLTDYVRCFFKPK